MNTLSKIGDLESRVLEMASWTAKERADHYGKSFASIVTAVADCAVIYCAMLQAGDDTSFVPNALGSYYKKIVAGQMLPGVLNLDNGLRAKVSALPIQDQKDILSGKRLRLVVIDEKKNTSIRLVDPKTLTPEQVKQLFGRGYQRSDEEQVSYLETDQMKARRASTPDSEVIFDKKNKCAVIGGVKYTIEDLAEFIKRLS